MFVGTCWYRLIFVGIWWYLLILVYICRYLLIFVDICCYLLISVVIFIDILATVWPYLKNTNNANKWKCQTWKSSKIYNFWRFQAKRTAPLNSAYFFAYCSTSQNWFSTFFRKLHVCDIRIIKKRYNLDVLKAWEYAQTICYSEELQIAYIKAEKDTRKHIFDISKVRKSLKTV